MIPERSPRPRHRALALTLALVATACGGGSSGVDATRHPAPVATSAVTIVRADTADGNTP